MWAPLLQEWHIHLLKVVHWVIWFFGCVLGWISFLTKPYFAYLAHIALVMQDLLVWGFHGPTYTVRSLRQLWRSAGTCWIPRHPIAIVWSIVLMWLILRPTPVDPHALVYERNVAQRIRDGAQRTLDANPTFDCVSERSKDGHYGALVRGGMFLLDWEIALLPAPTHKVTRSALHCPSMLVTRQYAEHVDVWNITASGRRQVTLRGNEAFCAQHVQEIDSGAWPACKIKA